jgi:cysteinyl-tRNA synthetase
VWQGPAAKEVPAEILSLIAERAVARSARDFARADVIRIDIAEQGWDVVDEAGGTIARPRAGSPADGR